VTKILVVGKVLPTRKALETSSKEGAYLWKKKKKKKNNKKRLNDREGTGGRYCVSAERKRRPTRKGWDAKKQPGGPRSYVPGGGVRRI